MFGIQALHVAPPQRLLTSGGLGEMGCALPAAIGASFASAKARRVIVIVGDGGLMMNLQELNTIAFHDLPVKIIVFCNDGYAMIKGTHKNIGIPYTGVDYDSGVSFPNFLGVAKGCGIEGFGIEGSSDIVALLQMLLESEGPAMMTIDIDPEQAYVPRLQPHIAADGTITPAKFSELSP